MDIQNVKRLWNWWTFHWGFLIGLWLFPLTAIGLQWANGQASFLGEVVEMILMGLFIILTIPLELLASTSLLPSMGPSPGMIEFFVILLLTIFLNGCLCGLVALALRSLKKTRTRDKVLVFIICVLLAIVIIPEIIRWSTHRRGRRRAIGHQVSWTQADFMHISLAVQLAVEDSQQLPPKKPDLFLSFIKQYARFIYECRTKDNAIVDVWHNPIVIKVESKHKYTLISLGPNGKDDHGGGDDIVYSFDPWKLADSERGIKGD